MSIETNFQQRIGFSGNLIEISKMVCVDFSLGEVTGCKPILIGYEDFNLYLETSRGKFFVKIFANNKMLDECKRNVDIMVEALKAGVSLPKLYPSGQGYLHIKELNGIVLQLCVMDFIDGKDYFSSKELVTKEDIKDIVRQAALINTLPIIPLSVYDHWAITNFPEEFKKKKEYLDVDDLVLLEPLIKKFQSLNIEQLPHCFVHGDIIETNVIKDRQGKIWIVDFSVSNYYPRIQELAVLGCDILFNKNVDETESNLKTALDEYQKTIKLSSQEIEALPTYIKLAHAMHVLCATYEKKANDNHSKENEYYLEMGRTGLRQD